MSIEIDVYTCVWIVSVSMILLRIIMLMCASSLFIFCCLVHYINIPQFIFLSYYVKFVTSRNTAIMSIYINYLRNYVLISACIITKSELLGHRVNMCLTLYSLLNYFLR